jgi:dihydropteroate synthase
MIERKKFRLQLPSRTLVLGERTLIMGVLNVTPDSFSDGGKFLHPQAAVDRAFTIERDGADIIDIGGESARPGSRGVSAQEELARILPVLEGLRGRLKVPVSLDTRHADVAEASAALGVEILNDVTGLRGDPRMADVARRHNFPIVLMHMRGEPRTMQKGPFAKDVLRDVKNGFLRILARARKANLPKSQIILDPGIGFGKNYAQNFELIARLPEFASLGCALLVGTSRKAFLGHALGGVAEDHRIWGTAATVAAAIVGGAHIVRVHDVAEMVQVARVSDCFLGPKRAEGAKRRHAN